MLKSLKLSGVGPAASMEASFAPRLNIFTGDNGLGKSFLLDVIWWSLTGIWPYDLNPGISSGRKALPQDTAKEAWIHEEFDDGFIEPVDWRFDFQEQEWKFSGAVMPPPLTVYGMVDGSFSVLGPQNYLRKTNRATVLTASEVWYGKNTGDIQPCRGLITDWILWQTDNKETWKTFCDVLREMSPMGEPLEPGTPTRINLDDARDIPTIRMPYMQGNDIPIVHASSAVKRILSLVYVLLWAWREHLVISRRLRVPTTKRIAVIIDEIDAHLHPRWQRTVLASLIRVIQDLTGAPEVQIFVSTHSPLVMASCEDIFDASQDAWLDLDLDGNIVKLTNRVFRPHGDANSWLSSDAFDMRSLRSVESQSVVDRAAAMLDSDNPPQEELRKLADELDRKLGAQDPFRNRWFTLVRAKFPGIV